MRSAQKTAIVPGHLLDQGDGIHCDLGLMNLSFGLPLPIQAEELPRPSEQGIWLNDHEGLLPSSNQPSQQDEEHPIRFRAGGSFHPPFEHDERLSQEGIFGDQL
jgi:hypothetical protein